MLPRLGPIRGWAEQEQERYCEKRATPREAERNGTRMLITVLFEHFLFRRPDPAKTEDQVGTPIIGLHGRSGHLLDRMLWKHRPRQASADQNRLHLRERPVSACRHGRLGTIVADPWVQTHT